MDDWDIEHQSPRAPSDPSMHGIQQARHAHASLEYSDRRHDINPRASFGVPGSRQCCSSEGSTSGGLGSPIPGEGDSGDAFGFPAIDCLHVAQKPRAQCYRINIQHAYPDLNCFLDKNKTNTEAKKQSLAEDLRGREKG
jgi:hypothetical protein